MGIKLTDNEHVLYKKAQNLEQDYKNGSEAMANLYSLLKQRNAIPEGRLRWFCDSEWNIGTKKSRMQVFISNGTPKSKITKHPHFFKHIKFFIEGPELQEKLLQHLEAERMNTQYDDEWCKDALQFIKRSNAIKGNAKDVAEEIFKLCAELNINTEEAKSLRQSILKLN